MNISHCSAKVLRFLPTGKVDTRQRGLVSGLVWIPMSLQNCNKIFSHEIIGDFSAKDHKVCVSFLGMWLA